MNIIFEGQIRTYKRLADRTLNITIGTQEMKGDQVGRINDLCDSHLKVFISNEGISDEIKEEIETFAITSKYKKNSNSKLLRNVLYRIWEKLGIEGDSEDFYDKKMLEMIDYFKEKYLNE